MLLRCLKRYHYAVTCVLIFNGVILFLHLYHYGHSSRTKIFSTQRDFLQFFPARNNTGGKINLTKSSSLHNKSLSRQPTSLNKKYATPEDGFKLNKVDSEEWIQIKDGVPCLIHGTEGRGIGGQCQCKPGWFGTHCSIPECVQTSQTYNQTWVKLSPSPRHVIMAIHVNREWSMIEARFHELHSVVDVFIVLESNYTLHGEPKELLLLKKLQNGFLSEFQHKIMYIFLDHFPKEGRVEGWIADTYTRNYMFTNGVLKLQGTSPRDIIIHSDADEVPSLESILYLKVHQGYHEPIGIIINWACYGFFYTQTKLLKITIASSLAFLEEASSNELSQLRGQKYRKIEGLKQKIWSKFGKAWYMGSEQAKAGWHCSWCFPPEDMQNKLVSAINGDFPRWGDYPEKRELPYIKNLVKTGTWFNGEKLIVRNETYKTDPSIVPKYIQENPEHFMFLLDLNSADIW